MCVCLQIQMGNIFYENVGEDEEKETEKEKQAKEGDGEEGKTTNLQVKL